MERVAAALAAMGQRARTIQPAFDELGLILVSQSRRWWRLAHELYHSSEIARDPSVVAAESVRALFERIGYRNKSCVAPVSCWETRAAVAFDALVTKELNGT